MKTEACINVCQVPREMLKTSAFGLGFQQLPRDLANVNAWKTMFDPYSNISLTNDIVSFEQLNLEFNEMNVTSKACWSVAELSSEM